jgi:5-dehydro-2-deoxygluconokinase
VGTEEELAAASGSNDVARGADALLASGIEALIIKRGARGATVFRRDRPTVDVAPFPIVVLNVLGAGDAFASGFLYGYLQGWPLERAVRIGNACGAIVVTRHGCANFMPTLDEVSAFVADRGEPAL